MVTTSRTVKRINNCRDMFTKAQCPRMRTLWKRNYEILMKKYWEDVSERILTAAGQVH